MDLYICPICGKRTMEKKELQPKKYSLVCKNCGYKYEMLPSEDITMGFV